MGDIKNHPLYSYNLKIYDDDFNLAQTHYLKLAEDVRECWSGFIDICIQLNGSAIKGNFAEKVDEYITNLGKIPGEKFYDAVSALSANLGEYIHEIDDADGKLY